MRSIESTVRIALATTAIAGGLAGCSSKFDNGDKLVAKENITVVTDYNASTVYKPTCEIKEGESVKVTGFSTLNLGSSDRQRLIELDSSTCTGWAIDSPSLNNKLK